MTPPASRKDNVEIVYLNYQGKRSQRVIKPLEMFWGSNEWHPQEQWLLRAFDYGKDAERTFAMRDILTWGCH